MWASIALVAVGIALVTIAYALLQRRLLKREIEYAERRGTNKGFLMVYELNKNHGKHFRNPVYGTPKRPHEIVKKSANST